MSYDDYEDSYTDTYDYDDESVDYPDYDFETSTPSYESDSYDDSLMSLALGNTDTSSYEPPPMPETHPPVDYGTPPVAETRPPMEVPAPAPAPSTSWADEFFPMPQARPVETPPKLPTRVNEVPQSSWADELFPIPLRQQMFLQQQRGFFNSGKMRVSGVHSMGLLLGKATSPLTHTVLLVKLQPR
jgi:hypothetical protein